MKWRVLVDNRTNDGTLQTEHGLAILLETEKHRVLLDTGASDMLIGNAECLGLDLGTVDYVFVSHGHSDHAGGLRYFMEMNQTAKVIVSPDAISGKFYSKRRCLHSITTEWPEIPAERLLDGLLMTCMSLPAFHRCIRFPRAISICSFKMLMASTSRMIFVTNWLSIQMACCLRVVLIVVWRISLLPVLTL